MPYAGSPYAGAPYAGSRSRRATVAVEQRGLGLWLDSTTKVSVSSPLVPVPGVPTPVVIHVVTPTVPVPTLVDGSPA